MLLYPCGDNRPQGGWPWIAKATRYVQVYQGGFAMYLS